MSSNLLLTETCRFKLEPYIFQLSVFEELSQTYSEIVKACLIDVSEAKYIRRRYFKKRKNIQSKTSGKTKTNLLAKYSEREKKRVKNLLYKASKLIARITAEEKVKPAMGRLTNIREKMRYGREMNRRLHSMPFRKIQFYTAYKSMERGLKLEFINAKNTSKTCQICGELNKPNGHVFKCRRCGFQEDGHLVAAWSIAGKLPCAIPYVGGESLQ